MSKSIIWLGWQIGVLKYEKHVVKNHLQMTYFPQGSIFEKITKEVLQIMIFLPFTTVDVDYFRATKFKLAATV